MNRLQFIVYKREKLLFNLLIYIVYTKKLINYEIIFKLIILLMKPIISCIFTYFFIQCSFSLKIKSDKYNTLFVTHNKSIKDNSKIRIINDYKEFLLSVSTFNSIDASITFSTLTNSLRFYNSTNPNIQNDEKIIAVAH